jgi:hypothetical protein
MEVAGANADYAFSSAFAVDSFGGAAQLLSLGCHAFMKTTSIIVLSGLLLCGCSQKQPSSAGSAIDRVQAGDTSWPDGPNVYSLHITKRDGNSLVGISISMKLPSGKTQTISADTATLSLVPNAPDDKSVMVTFHNPKLQVDSQSSAIVGDYPMELHE